MRSRNSTTSPAVPPHRAAPCRGFVPPYLLRRVAEAGLVEAGATLDEDVRFRAVRNAPALRAERLSLVARAGWTVHDARNGTELPGTPVRSSGGVATGDVAVDEAADGIEAALAMYRDGFGRDSFDGAGAHALVTVHYGRSYANAFWDGSQLVFGDGDGQVFDRFTKPVDVLGHELAHGLVEHTAALVYRDQPGALNESVADVTAACLKQRLLGQDAAGADWLIGEGIFLPGVAARALRDMAAPGTAYDDARLGRDPQVGHMDDFVVTAEDDGGVHINSGIPNRAFQLAATAIGGDSLSGAGQIWYAALTGGQVGPQTDFASFAAATVAVAGQHADAVAAAWEQVGVPVGVSGASVASGAGGSGAGGSGSAAGAPVGRLRMTRSGGFAGLSEVYEVDLADADDEVADVRAAWQRVDAAQSLTRHPVPSTPQPDRFSYTFQVGEQAPVRVAEQDLDDHLRGLAEAVRNCPRARAGE